MQNNYIKKSYYIPIRKNHMCYSHYLFLKDKIEKNPNYIHYLMIDGKEYKLTRKQTEAYLHCLGCDIMRVNLWVHFCKNFCSDWWRNVNAE